MSDVNDGHCYGCKAFLCEAAAGSSNTKEEDGKVVAERATSHEPRAAVSLSFDQTADEHNPHICNRDLS